MSRLIKTKLKKTTKRKLKMMTKITSNETKATMGELDTTRSIPLTRLEMVSELEASKNSYLKQVLELKKLEASEEIGRVGTA